MPDECTLPDIEGKRNLRLDWLLGLVSHSKRCADQTPTCCNQGEAVDCRSDWTGVSVRPIEVLIARSYRHWANCNGGSFMLTGFLTLSLVLGAAMEQSGGSASAQANDVLVVHCPGFPYIHPKVKSLTVPGIKLKQTGKADSGPIPSDKSLLLYDTLDPSRRLGGGHESVPATTRFGELKFFRIMDGGAKLAIYESKEKRKDTPKDGSFDSIYDEVFRYYVVIYDQGNKEKTIYDLDAFHPGILEMNNSEVVGSVLYFDMNYNGYADIAKNKTGYLAALDLTNGEILWTSKNLTSSYCGFVVYGEYIVSGYGFTAEPDFLYVLNRHNGKVLQTVKLKTAHEAMLVRTSKSGGNDELHVRTYDTNYVFEISISKSEEKKN